VKSLWVPAVLLISLLTSVAVFGQEPTAPASNAPTSNAPAKPTAPAAQPTQDQAATPEQETETPSAPEPPASPRFELFGGYSYIGGDPFSVGHRVGLNGWEGTIDINFTRWLRVVADFGGNYGTSHIPIAFTTPFPPCTPLCPGTFDTFPVSTHQYTYEFGADFPYRRWDKIVPYGQALFGRAHVSGTANGIGETRGTTEYDSKFSMLLGMGFDYNISPRFAWRLQADYLQTKFFSQTEDNYRVSTGIVWKITRRKKKRTLVTP